VVDDFSTGFREALLGADLVVGDVADSELIERTVRERGVTAIVHFAARKAVGESMEQPAHYFMENVGKSTALFEAARQAGVQHVVFSSSAALYGQTDELPVREDQPLRPENPYGESKAMVERVLHWFDVCHGVRSVSLRYFNASGSSPDAALGEDPRTSQNLMPRVVGALLGRTGPVTVFGDDYPTPDGTCQRDYVHVDDLAAAHVLALDYVEAGGVTTAVNLGQGVAASVLEVIAAVGRAGGREVPYSVGPRRPGDPPALYADIRRAAELLGWRPRNDLATIAASAVAWSERHPDGYSS
jgi:UDP-glucose-4-epimerase GalE